MSLLKPIMSFLIFAVQAWPKMAIVDAKSCENKLSPAFFQNFVAESSQRKNLEGVGSFLPGDEAVTKLIDVRGSDDHRLAASIIKFLHFDQDASRHPRLMQIIEAAERLAHEQRAILSVSSWIMPDDGLRTIRISLDMTADRESPATIIRLPSLDIRNGSHSKRIDIDITPDRLAVQLGTAQALTGFGKIIVGEPASHTRGLYLTAVDEKHPVIDAGMAPTEHFIGDKAYPQLNELLNVAEGLAKAVYPETQDISFRTNEEIHALQQGNGWQIRN